MINAIKTGIVVLGLWAGLADNPVAQDAVLVIKSAQAGIEATFLSLSTGTTFRDSAVALNCSAHASTIIAKAPLEAGTSAPSSRTTNPIMVYAGSATFQSGLGSARSVSQHDGLNAEYSASSRQSLAPIIEQYYRGNSIVIEVSVEDSVGITRITIMPPDTAAVLDALASFYAACVSIRAL